ncbi:MAG: amidohydrolase family protein [Acidobacteria bacterium]|nr:amidohydrolase family protein [Acidobacteriota bacterium]
MDRRHFFSRAAALAFGSAGLARAQQSASLPLPDFEPKSELGVTESRVERARYPVIDMHTHVSWSPGLEIGDTMRYAAEPTELLPVMDRKNIRTMVNLTGGWGAGLEDCVGKFAKAHPGRFIVFTEPRWHKTTEAGYAQWQGDEIEKAYRAGAKGIKVLKTLGLYLRDKVKTGTLVKVDDARFDPMWEAAGARQMPIAIHTSDPVAFFRPIDKFNERYEELNAHPDWSFGGRDFPSDRELQEARRRVMKRHPKTQFVCLHVAVAENLAYVSEMMDAHPNMWVEFGARIGELGRQPRAARKFFDRYQDRILFGTDAVPHGDQFPQQVFGEKLYEIYYRFLETQDEYFDYAPARVPPQGRWKIYGLGLPDAMLKKIYNGNASRLLNLKV